MLVPFGVVDRRRRSEPNNVASAGRLGRAFASVPGLLVFCSMLACAAPDGPRNDETARGHGAVSGEGFLSHVTVGYQGWFAAPGDGSPIGGWSHWSGGTPAPGSVTFELYPDVRDYADEDLHDTGLGVLGDGRPARLWSSYSAGVVDTHFRWMEEAGIDGVGLQRFVSELGSAPHLAHRNHVTELVRDGAETHGRVFYVEYDISSAHEATLVDRLTQDWSEVIVGQLGATGSPQYARQDGRPVVMLWGFGFSDRPGSVAQAKAAVAWFKQQGCFVGVGVPYEWRTEQGATKPGFLEAYAEADLIQPWAVGAVANDADVQSHFADIVAKDIAWTSTRGIAYQRVIFPGFAWSNWHGGSPNMIPRRAGRFFWTQAYEVRKANIGAFVAMFDEYDEGTAIAKAAEDAGSVPVSQYFLALDADGTHVSSDFYLRLTGAATRMIRGEAPHVAEVPIPTGSDGGGSQPPPPASSDVVPPQQSYGGQVAPLSAADAEGVVRRLYRAILGREADDGGMAAYVPLVQEGRLPEVASALITSGEFEARRAALTATGLAGDFYARILERAADESGLATTAQAIRDAHGAHRAVDMFLSPEYGALSP